MTMEQFEKWSKKYYPNNVAVFYCNQKEGWKAACEHWLQVAKEHDQEMQFMIEDELDDGN